MVDEVALGLDWAGLKSHVGWLGRLFWRRFSHSVVSKSGLMLPHGCVCGCVWLWRRVGL